MRTIIRVAALELAHRWWHRAELDGVSRTKFYFQGDEVDTLPGDKVIRVTVKVMTRAEYEKDTGSGDVGTMEEPA